MTAAGIQEEAIARGLRPMAEGVSGQFAIYLDLLLRWNAKLNLTAITDPLEMVRRHFIESIFCAQQLPSGIGTLLDFGSGGGFPGLPIALCRRDVSVTLGESQGKKAAFLREAVRSTGATAEVYGERIENMGTRSFDCVTLRAVDKMQDACLVALQRLSAGGWLAIFSTRASLPQIVSGIQAVAWRSPLPIPGSEQGVLLFGRRLT